jgi:predicted  nucleic acid-binding Zn-ribbon protein
MADPQIEKLLIVQDRDLSLQKIEQELARLPQERDAIDRLIKLEESNVALAHQSLKDKEVQRKQIDLEVQAKGSAINRFKTQQLEVKKNEEYRALTHQIDQSEKEVLELEEKEIELMLEIDTARATFGVEKAEIEARIQVQLKEIETLVEREKNLAASLDPARANVGLAREGADALYLQHYDRVKTLTRRGLYVGRIESRQCSGCHLRVSNEVSHAALQGGEPYFCDQCARIVYA